MSLFTYQSGDCGVGYFKSVLLVTLLVTLAFAPNAIVMISWIATNGVGLIFIPLIYNNAFIIPSWILGVIALIPGLLAAFSQTHSKRLMMLNIWVVSLIAFTIAIAAAGIYLVHFIATDTDIFEAGFREIGSKMGKAAGIKPLKEGSNFKNAVDRGSEYAKGVAAYSVYKMLSYPLSAFYFLHWQVGVTAVAFAVIPILLSLWALYHALGNRNFFAKDPAAYKNQRISDGPLFTDDTSDEESHSDSESSSASETEPLSKRHTDSMPSVTTHQDRNSIKGKVVVGRKVV